MGTELNKALSWEIDNLCGRKEDRIKSELFSSGGCEWSLVVFPKGYCGLDHLALFLQPESVRPGWKRRARFCFVMLTQSGKVLSRSSDTDRSFYAEVPNWGFFKSFSLTKFGEEGFLENNKLIIQVYIKVLEVVHQGKPTANDLLVFNGFQILASQVPSVNKIFADHPGFEKDFIPKSQGVRTAYMNLLLALIKTLMKSPQSLSLTELSNAQSELDDLTEAGFKLDWLKSKLEEVSLERKNALSDGSNLVLQQLEERVKNVESLIVAQHRGFAKDFKPKSEGVRTTYMNLLLGLIEILSKSPQSLSVTELSNAQSELDDLTEAGLKLEWLKTKLEEVSLERKKALSGGSWVQQQLKEQVKNADSLIVAQHPNFIPKSQGVITAYMNLLGLIETLSKSPQSLSVTELSNAQSELDDLTDAGFKLGMLKSKLEEVSLERKKALSDGSNWGQQQLEERVKNVESTMSDLKVELEQEKIKSAAVAAAARVTSFDFIDYFIKRFFLSCFSISKY